MITLDVLLPDISGLAVLEWLHADGETATIPVMLLSILADDGRGRRLGAVDCLTKPVDDRVLCARVDAILAERGSKLVLLAEHDPQARGLLAGHLRGLATGATPEQIADAISLGMGTGISPRRPVPAQSISS